MNTVLVIYIIIAYCAGLILTLRLKSKITVASVIRLILAPIVIPIGLLILFGERIARKRSRRKISKYLKDPKSREDKQSGNNNDENFTHKEDDLPGMVPGKGHLFSIALRKALIGGNFTEFEQNLDNNVTLTLYRYKTLTGKDETISYWKDWKIRYQELIKKGDFIIRYCGNYSQYGLNVILDRGSSYIYFREYNGVIVDIVYINEMTFEGAVGHFWNTNDIPYSIEYFKKYIGDEIPNPAHSLPCLQCGCRSHNLKWNRFTYPVGIHGYGGEISTCPNCNRIVDIYTNIRFRYETPQRDQNEFVPKGLKNGEFPVGLYGKYSWTVDNVLEETGYTSLHVALQNNIGEAANNLGMLAANQDNIDEAIKYFQLAISSCNSHNAMLNLTMLYWATLEDYAKSVELMKAIATRPEPALRCLWNLAYLQFMGNKVKDNPIKKDLNACKATLEKIISFSDNPKYEKDLQIITNAKACIPLTITNQFSEKAKEFHSIIATYGEETEYTHDPKRVLDILNKITVPAGKYLLCHHADMQIDDNGDNTFLYVNDGRKLNRDNRFDAITDTWKNVQIEPDEMGVWQLYLLMTSIRIMPSYWHGGYQNATYILNESDLYSIEPLKVYDLSALINNKLILPTVEMTRITETQSEGLISCTYWSEWGGLIRETIKVQISGKAITNYDRISKVSLFKYDCGILY